MAENNFHIEMRDMTNEEVKSILEEFERKYGMSSEEFYKKWNKGEADWVSESVEWSGLFEAYKAHNGQVVTQPEA